MTTHVVRVTAWWLAGHVVDIVRIVSVVTLQSTRTDTLVYLYTWEHGTLQLTCSESPTIWVWVALFRALWCFLSDRCYPYLLGLILWHFDNRTIAPLPGKRSRRICTEYNTWVHRRRWYHHFRHQNIVYISWDILYHTEDQYIFPSNNISIFHTRV